MVVVAAAFAGLLQGVLEWLPVSSEGNLAIVLAAAGADPGTAVALALFLHLGTACSATAYYRDELRALARGLPGWAGGGSAGDRVRLRFLAVATLVSGVVGVAAYALLAEAVSSLAGGTFIGLVGALLVVTGLVERSAGGLVPADRRSSTLGDAVLVGAVQGLAVLPGVSRSGTTTSALLLRGHDGPAAVQLSFLLSIPAAVGGGLIAVVDAGGLPALPPVASAVALATAAVVGYGSLGAVTGLVERVPFWAVCCGLGALAIAGWLVLAVG